MNILLFTLIEKELLLQNLFKKGIKNYSKFNKKELIKMQKLFDEILNYGN